MNLYQINKIHSISLFFFCLIVFSLIDLGVEKIILDSACFFLIAIIGVSHGSLDHQKGYKILKLYGIKNKSFFYLTYILISLSVIIFWYFFPILTLLLFLIVASYHFGKEDSNFGDVKKTKFLALFYFFKGTLIVLAPLWANLEESLEIFSILSVEVPQLKSDIILILNFFSVLSNIFINKNFEIAILDSLTIIILNIFLSPLVAFTVYFCFLHSIRHSISLIQTLDKNNFKKGLKKFVISILPLTLITATLFLISLYFLLNFYNLSDSILKVIFIGLASLTFPHILLEYLLEKNEK